MAYTKIEGDYGRTAGVDQTSSALCSISTQHARIHDGDAFVASRYVSPVASGTDTQLLLVTPNGTIDAHLTLAVGCSDLVKVELSEDTTKTFADGNKLSIVNCNRNSGAKGKVKICHTPSGSGDGTTILACVVGPAAGFSAKHDGAEFILKRDTKYLLKLTNLSAFNNSVSVIASWYETETTTFPQPTSTTS